MDHSALLEAVRKHFDENNQLIRGDIERLSEKVDDYQERLVKVESTMGFIKAGTLFLLSLITASVTMWWRRIFPE